mmetsp:Transcript_1527/g.3740  ORF Transcript_1527/g.3740 Transcript_1527/m.3740 type:complete len:131 (+) Transcript_1527:83-475(+)
MATPVFTRFVEPGRVCMCDWGANAGKPVIIVDMVTAKRVIVEGLGNDIPRQQMPVRWLSLTPVRAAVHRGQKQKTLRKAIKDQDVIKKFSETNEAKAAKVREFKANMTDFDRFKLMLARKALYKVSRGKK